ncbi:hypothetical protein ACLMJK_005644 [Lecanora helva]
MACLSLLGLTAQVAPYQLALLGYVVIATDYAGLGVGKDASNKPIVHEYLNGRAQANDVAYSIPAARKAFPALSERFIALGSSEDGLAAWGFAEKLVAEPMEGHLGTVALSPATRLLNLPPTAAIMPQLLLMIAPSLIATYPDFDPAQIFTLEGQQSLETYMALKGCNSILFSLPSANILKNGWQGNITIQKWQENAAVSGKPIRGYMLIIQGAVDSIISPQSVTDAIDRTLEAIAWVRIEYHLLPDVSHAPAMYAGLQTYLDWIAARFLDHPIEPGFTQHNRQPVRPASSQHLEADWFSKRPQNPGRRPNIQVSDFSRLYSVDIVEVLGGMPP